MIRCPLALLLFLAVLGANAALADAPSSPLQLTKSRGVACFAKDVQTIRCLSPLLKRAVYSGLIDFVATRKPAHCVASYTTALARHKASGQPGSSAWYFTPEEYLGCLVELDSLTDIERSDSWETLSALRGCFVHGEIAYEYTTNGRLRSSEFNCEFEMEDGEMKLAQMVQRP